LKDCDVGAFGIKPFAAGSLFTGEREEDMRRARLALRYILLSDTVIPIPGVHSVDHVDNIAKAVKERRELDVREVSELERASEQTLARLPAHYQWLRHWRYV
jgi:aryl-alcohol dehydrogenase-like predicted oxidoreductase